MHLESPDLIFCRNQRLRHEHIEILKTVVEDRGSELVAGDFKVVFDDRSEVLIPPTWRDIWITLHPEDPSQTWDPTIKGKASQEGSFILPGFRLDRILLISDGIKADSARLLGRDAPRPLSDPDGLAVQLSCTRHRNHFHGQVIERSRSRHIARQWLQFKKRLKPLAGWLAIWWLIELASDHGFLGWDESMTDAGAEHPDQQARVMDHAWPKSAAVIVQHSSIYWQRVCTFFVWRGGLKQAPNTFHSS